MRPSKRRRGHAGQDTQPKTAKPQTAEQTDSKAAAQQEHAASASCTEPAVSLLPVEVVQVRVYLVAASVISAPSNTVAASIGVALVPPGRS